MDLTLLKREFPAFDVSTLPELPEGFADSSYRNDVCPSFTDEARGLQVFIDCADPQERESATSPRFTLMADYTDYGVGSHVAHTDDWSEMLRLIEQHDKKHMPRKLAGKFSAVLREYLSPKEMRTVIERNRAETNPQVCHSHDFCDANEAMLEAFESFGISLDAENEKFCALWNAAWDVAKQSEFNTAI